MASVRGAAYSAKRTSVGAGRALLDELLKHNIVPPNTHANEQLIVAAAAAVDAGFTEFSEAAQLQPHLPVGQRTERMKVWVAHVRSLRGLTSLSTTTVKRSRITRGPSSGASISGLAWKLWLEGTTTESVVIDDSTGLPSTPCQWRLIPKGRIGCGFTSAPLAARTLCRLPATGMAAASMIQPDCTKLSLADLERPAGRPSYVRITLSTAASRERVVSCALGQHASLAALKSPFDGYANHRGFVMCDEPPVPGEGLGQVWLAFGDTANLGSCHYDRPHGVLVVLGGVKRIALLPPAAVTVLGLPTMGQQKLDAKYNAFDDDRFASGGLGHGVMQVAVLSAGHAVFVPHGWWHQVESSPRCVGVSLAVQAAV